jgi:sulfur carrier protein
MTIQLNGESRSFEAGPLSLAVLLDLLGLGGKPVVVELDREAVFAKDYEATTVADGAKVEIVMIAAGG